MTDEGRRTNTRRATRSFLGAIVPIACALASAAAQAATTSPPKLLWKGIEWNVKSGVGKNPGFNSWSPANAFVDANGDLHLAITNVGGTWSCAEVWTDVAFPFGTFQWQVASRVDNLDPNVVLGLFAYGPPALGPDGTHEIDIEYARFGSASADIGRWTIFPNVITTPSLLGRSSYPLVLAGDPATTSRFSWGPTNLSFATLAGLEPVGSDTDPIHSWVYSPADPAMTISQSAMPVHMNLWLFRGNPPTDGQGVEIVVHDFSFAPAVVGTTVPALGAGGTWILASGLLGAGALLVTASPFRRGRRRRGC